MRKFFSLITAFVLCTAMWGDTYKTFYKVQGALYQGINVDFTTNKNMFVPNGATVTYSTFDGKPADWYNNGNLKKSGVSSYTASNLADGNYYKYQIKNYTGYDAQDPKIDYMYGTVDNKSYFLRAGSGTMYMMSMANAYCVCTESSTASNVGKYYVDNRSMLTLGATDAKTYGTSMKYGTNFSYAKNGGLIFAYEMLVDNPGEMYIDYIVLPIFGYPKSNETTIEKMIPEGAKLTLTLYPIDLTLSDEGIYSYTRKTPAITTVTATAENFKQGDKVYDGTVMFDLKDKPVLISGDFVARLTWDDGCEFGLITDDNNLQNFTTFYLWKDEEGKITKSYFWGSTSANASISYHAMFPVLEKKDTKTALEFTHEGGGDEVAIKSNIDPASKDFTIDFGGATWVSLDSLRYTTEGKYVAKETVYVVFKTEANEGEAREATITLKHHGKVLTYTVSQEAAPAPVEPTYLYLKAGEVDYMKDGAVVYLYSWGGSSEADWSKFELIQNETTAKASMMKDRTGMKIVRFASGTTTPSWQGTIWNQTGDISVSSDFPEKVDMIELSAWDGAKDATWSKYGGAVEKPKHDYTITVYLPAFCDDIAAYADSVRVMGGFDDWSNGIWMEEKIDEDFNEYWYAEIKDVEEDTEFKLRFGTDADWKVQVQLNGANMANEAFGETTDIVLHYDGEGYGFAACAAPAARKEFVFVAGEAADSDPAMFAITWGKDGSSETVKMEKQEEALYAADILATVDSVVLVRCATGATEIIWGEGTNVWNQTVNYALCDTMYFGEWTEEGLFTLTCEAPKPVETKYYAKNNWNGGEWSWKEMAKKEDLYVLDSVVFGGTGVNLNTKEDDADAVWFDLDKLTYNEKDTIQALDTVRFELAISEKDTVLKAIIIGRPAPAPRKEFTFIAGEVAESNPTLFAITWGKDGSNETVKLANKEADIYTAEILETVDSLVLVRCATGATDIIWEGEGQNVWNQTDNYAICDTMYFGAWVDGSNRFTITCEAPKPVEVKYYITGNAALVGEDKAWNAQAIEMTDSAYVFTELAAGEYEMKITNGAWDPEGQSWGSAALSEECSAGVGDKSGNIYFVVETANDVTVSIANGKVTVIGTFKQVATGITVNVTVPEGTPACFFYGEMSGNTFVEMTKVDDTHYTKEFPKATSIGWGYKFVWENGNWSTCNADPEGDIKIEPVEGVITVEVKAWATAPGTEYKYTTYTEWQVKFGPAWEWVNMTKQEDGTFTVEAVWGNTGINIASGENPIKQDWYALDDPALTVEEDVVEGDNVVITLTVVDDETVALNVAKGETPQPVETKYYITGNEALCGEKAWNAQAIEMKDSTHTFTAMAAGEYEMKITNGAWDPEGQSWGSAALSEECSAGVGDKDGNIHFIVETPNNVVVSIANGKVTVTGTFKEEPVTAGITVNVTVPEGTPACFFYGEMSGNTFVEMTKVDETHYTIDFPKATTIGWGYKFVWENGNWSTCNADPEGDIKVEPVEGVINVEVKAWATAPGTEYKYTTYTEWQVKFGPAWEWVNMTKQEDGTFTVEAVWGNTGINIASGENPIKKDWYALDDPALTVEEGVVEGGNVVITLTVVDDETVALNVAKGQEPATPDFGLLVNGTDYLPGTPEDKDTYTEYAVNLNLMVGEFVQLYDNVNKAAWTVTPEAIGFTDFDIHDNAYYIKQTGAYQFYIKIPKEGTESGLYVGFQGSGTNLNNLKALDGKRYNILGQPVNETYRGIVIMNGQTYLQ